MSEPVRRRWLTIALLAELVLVAVAGVAAIGLPAGDGGVRRYVVIGLLAAGMGVQNATVRRLAVASASRDWLERAAQAGAGDLDYSAVLATITGDRTPTRA